MRASLLSLVLLSSLALGGAAEDDGATFNERVEKKFAKEDQAAQAKASGAGTVKGKDKDLAQQLRTAAEDAAALDAFAGGGGAARTAALDAFDAAAATATASAVDDRDVPVGEGVLVKLTDGSFANNLLRTPHFVKFFAPWCGHCKAIAPGWERLAAKINVDASGKATQASSKTRIAEVDCDAHARTCKNFRVTGFPRLLLIAMTKDPETGALGAEFVKYDGPREEAPMMQFVLETADVAAAARAGRAAAAAAREKADGDARALAKADEELAAAENPTRHTQIVTAASFGALFGAANASDSAALLLHVFVPPTTAPEQAKIIDLRGGTWKKLAKAVADDGELAQATVVGTLNCRAHPALCHEDGRFGLPRSVQWPQLIKFRRANIAGADFPGELYEGNLEDPLEIFAFAAGKAWAAKAVAAHFPGLKAKQYEESFPDMASSFAVWARGKAALLAAAAAAAAAEPDGGDGGGGDHGDRAQAGAAFLLENGAIPGVNTRSDTALQYRVLKSGEGKDHPTLDAKCEVHYVGAQIDGTVFDSSYKRGEPTVFAPKQVVPGWTEILQLMVEGDKFEVYLPPKLGYGDKGSPPQIKGGDVLVFQMELVAIQGERKPATVYTRLSGAREDAKASPEKEEADAKASPEKKEVPIMPPKNEAREKLRAKAKAKAKAKKDEL